MGKTIGIDLGTTNSVVSCMENGDAVVIATAEGGRTCPSVVAFNKQGERLVGETAKRQAVVNPENTIYSIKRFMGQKFGQTEVERKRVSYQTVAGPVGDVRVHIPMTKKDYSPQEISAAILSKLKTDAENFLGEKVEKAVITVPAYFNDAQRQATKDAGKIAGLDVIRIVNEPTAAAMAYGLDKKNDETVLVCDLGGGTFDVSLLEVGGGVIEVKATNGDTHLGGDDWDDLIVKWLTSEFKQDTGIDLNKDKPALQRLKESAEKAKIELSNVMETEINLPYITADSTGPKHLVKKLNRATFEKMSQPLLERMAIPMQAVIKDSGIDLNKIDEVVLVGGSTRMPMAQEKIREITHKEPNKSVNPDEVVAMGAAIQAGVIGGEVKNLLLLDVTPLSLGLETLGGVMTRLIERNSTIPIRKSEIFSTAADGQTAVEINVLQGERPQAKDNNQLGVFHLDNIPAAPRGIPQIEVTFDIDANGILTVSALDKASGQKQHVTITSSTNLSKNEIDRIVQEAAANEARDKEFQELAQLRNEADQHIYQAQQLLKTAGDKIEDRVGFENAIKMLEDARQSGGKTEIENAKENLQKLTYEISTRMYQGNNSNNNQQAPNMDGGFENNSGNGQSPDSDGDVVEGEFRSA